MRLKKRGKKTVSNYEIEVLVRGRPVKVFKHKGDRFIEGRHGSTFELKITNNTWDRVEVVTSVDGLSVSNGEECGSNSEGYLVPAKESIVIPGWRLPNNKAAEFVFEDKRKSYSNQVGKGTQNVGVIGLMIFVEKVVHNVTTPTPIPFPNPIRPYPTPRPHPYPHPWEWDDGFWPKRRRDGRWNDPVWISSTSGDNPQLYKSAMQSTNESLSIKQNGHGEIGTTGLLLGMNICDTAAGASATASLQDSVEPAFEIGTGWGDEIKHNVTEVSFERENRFNPDEILSIFYDTKKGLEARGIKVVKTKKRKTKNLPNAFPTYKNSGCTPPPGWKNRK